MFFSLLLLAPPLLALPQQEHATVMWRAEGPSPGAAYGQSVRYTTDLNGDGIRDMIQHCPNASTGSLTNNGALYALSGMDGSLLWELHGWTDELFFGVDLPSLLDISGDGVEDFLVATPNESSQNLIQSGSLYAIDGALGLILWQRDGQEDYEQLGDNYLVMGDLNGDGPRDIVVGFSRSSQNGLSLNGTVRLISGQTGQDLWVTSGALDGEFLGETIAHSNDITGDGIADIIAGGPTASTNGHFKNGVAKALSGADGSILWSYSGTTDFQGWGKKVFGAKDVNGDSYPEVLVTNPGASTHGLWQNGVLGLFDGATGAQLWELNGTADYMQLGQHASGIGDVDADGSVDFCLGIPYAMSNGIANSGEIRCVSGIDGSTLWSTPGTQLYGLLGENMTALDDLDGDFIYEVFTASPDADANGMIDSGFAMLLSGSDGSITWELRGSNNGEHLGENWTTRRDFNGDGVKDILVGSPYAEHNGIFNAGKLFCIDSASGSFLWTAGGQEREQMLGQQLHLLDDIDGDGVLDVASSAHDADLNGLINNGYFVAYSGATGSLLWELIGETDSEHLGRHFVRTEDRDFDGCEDILLSSHYADPRLKPDAGVVVAYSSSWLRHLQIDSLMAGTSGVLNVHHAVPGAIMHFAASLTGPGVTPTSYPGLTLALSPRLHVAGSAQVDSSGLASLTIQVPGSLSGQCVWIQAAQDDSGTWSPSNLSALRIQ